MTNHPNRSKPKKLHAADITAREAIAQATAFSVYQYRHRARYMRDGFITLAQAAAHAAEVERANPARPALIYAYLNGIGHPVPNDLRAAASAQAKGPTP